MATVKAIKYGMKGDDVANLQTTLKNLGYNIDVDGSFGPQTLAAVKSYQQANGLDVDGMVGPQTTAALYGSGSKTSYSNTSPSAMSGADAGSPAVVPSNSTPTTATSRPASSSSLPTPSTPTQDAGTNSVLTDDGMKVVVPEGSTAPATNTSIPTQSNPNAGSLNTDVEATPAVVPNSAPGAGSASPTGTEIMYPDKFSYDDFTYEDYQSSGKVDKAVGDGFSYDKFSYADYAESETVQQANAALQAILAAQPGAYQSKWQSQIDDIINRILNREEFSYDVNEDALYQQYKDQYIQGGKLAMQDTMGQAAAMTGGYGNSYAASVGNQAYQNYLSQLNEVVPELYGMALDRYNMEGEEMYNQYGLLSSQEQQDYARYQDSYNQWLAERDYATGRYDSEREYDYSKYVDDRNYEYGVYSDDRAQKYSEYLNAIDLAKWQETDAYNKYLNDKNFAYGAYADSKQYAYNDYLTDIEKAQYNAQFLEDQRQYNANMAFNKEQAAISNSQWEQSFAEQQKQNAIGNDQWQQSFDESVKQNAIGNSQWEKSFAEQQKQNAISNAQWETSRQDTLDSENRAYAREEVLAVIANGGTPNAQQLKVAGLTKKTAEAMVAVSSGDEEEALKGVKSMSYPEMEDALSSYKEAGKVDEAKSMIQYLFMAEMITPEMAEDFLNRYTKSNGHAITDTTVVTPSSGRTGGSAGKFGVNIVKY